MSEHTKEPLSAWSDDTALMGPEAPEWDGHIEHLIRYLLTVHKRFGNTAVTVSLQWGASALWKRDAQAKRIVELEAKVAALTKERDEFEISNAFAHGEWKAVKDQLAARTREHELACEIGADYRDKWMAAKALAFPADDSALMERLKQERERAVREYIEMLCHDADPETPNARANSAPGGFIARSPATEGSES